MKSFIFCLLLLPSLFSKGQSISEIKQLLSNKDSKVFQKYLDTAKNNKSLGVRIALQRDITPEFQEMVVAAYEHQERINEPDIYRFNIIASESKIAFADFEAFSSHVPENNNRQPHSNNRIIDLSLMDSLYVSFMSLYHADLQMKDLFDGTTPYGNLCSDGGKADGRVELDNILKQRNYARLDEWLQSANVEKQVYAIDGLCQLKRLGFTFTKQQENLIELIRRKKGNVSVCQGCILSSESIGSVIDSIMKK